MRFNAIEFRNGLLRMHQERGEEIGALGSQTVEDARIREEVLIRERAFIMDLVHALDSATDEDA